jgi:hypothetical protein
VATDGSSAGLEQRLDELYREHPERFVAKRNELAKELRAAGDLDESERVRKLRRPTVVGWLINRAALTSPAQLKDFAEASRELEEAQRRALAGEDEGAAAWRAAAARESEVIGEIVDLAEEASRDAGHPASGQAVQLAAETLRAASGDPDLRERVLRGRVEREQSAATLGPLAAGPPRRRDRGSEKRRELSQARRDLERLEAELADASAREGRLRARVEETEAVLRREKEALAEAKREATRLRRQAKSTEKRARG